MKRFIFVTWMVMGGMLCARPMRAQGAVSFPYPEIPVSISEPRMRLSYLLNHFWDNFLFADTSQTNRKLAEQGMADYLNLLPHVEDSASQCSAVDVFVRQAFADASRSEAFENLLEHYLGNPASPLRNDGLYALLLRRIAMTLPEGDARLERYRQHQRLLSMYAPGTTKYEAMVQRITMITSTRFGLKFLTSFLLFSTIGKNLPVYFYERISLLMTCVIFHMSSRSMLSALV